jgi:Spy/CpxP family protein refolding chaperone
MTNRAMKLAALLLCAATATLAAQDGPPPGRGGPGGRGGRGGPGGGACANGPDSLTTDQRSQVRALGDAFMKAHAVQLDSLRTIMEAARAARQAGQSQQDIQAIMATGKSINDELAPDRKAVGIEIVKLLTPAQIAAHCIPPVPGGGPPGGGGRRGGPPPPRPPQS